MITLLRRNQYFYPLVFGVWALFLLVRFGNHRYFDVPPESAGYERGGGMSKVSMLHNSIVELQKSLVDERRSPEKPHILQNIGCAYYDLYREIGDRRLLDSAYVFFSQSISEGPGNARFHYNLGRLFTEVNNQQGALQAYEMALKYEPAHILALSNAGMCSYFAFGQKKAAAGYFGRALAIDSTLPMCHYVLGLIGLDEKDFAAARADFEKEVVAGRLAMANNRLPIQRQNIMYAAGLAHRSLMTIYSSHFPDVLKANAHYEAYLSLETDPAKKEEAAQEMKKKWGKR
ncbi:MAG: tetratricopeptide repeat protein [Chitinispirillaceae bacterium]|jgi:tetratricopeptide (TPR) repeat protein|nr:tetratricopeptide repeat protein [Chitinispirillaceae bacterium]